LELAAGGGADATGAAALADPEVEPVLEVDAVSVVFLLWLFLVEDVDASAVAGALEESVDAVLVSASAAAFFDRDFFALVELSAVAADSLDVSLASDFADLEDRDFLVLAESLDPDVAEASVALDLDFFDLLVEVPLPEVEVSFAEESAEVVFFFDFVVEVPELPAELSFALASELAEVFLDFFLLVVLLLPLASDG
ncbi:MAG: hypothetical protein WCC67_15315, partial [Candidatus Acidiferrales bacterium]